MAYTGGVRRRAVRRLAGGLAAAGDSQGGQPKWLPVLTFSASKIASLHTKCGGRYLTQPSQISKVQQNPTLVFLGCVPSACKPIAVALNLLLPVDLGVTLLAEISSGAEDAEPGGGYLVFMAIGAEDAQGDWASGDLSCFEDDAGSSVVTVDRQDRLDAVVVEDHAGGADTVPTKTGSAIGEEDSTGDDACAGDAGDVLVADEDERARKAGGITHDDVLQLYAREYERQSGWGVGVGGPGLHSPSATNRGG